MKTKFILWISALFLLLWMGAGCGKEKKISCSCECAEEKIPIVTLKDETAHIRISEDDITIVLDDKEIIPEHYLIPRGCHIPERYRKDGISIVISGEVFDCSEYIKPEIKRASAYFVKLSTIKKK